MPAAGHRPYVQRRRHGQDVDERRPGSRGPTAAPSGTVGAGTADREVPGAPAAADPAGPPATLTNPRFADMPRLQDIAAGGPILGRRDPRDAVRAVQQALLDVGYSMLHFNADGRFGSETADAIRQFRADRGLAPDGGLDAEALLALDRSAPAAGVAQEHYVDYERLFADNRLDVAFAIGFDDSRLVADGPTYHQQNIDHTHSWLAAQQFALVGSTPPSPETGPTELWRLVRRISYPTRSGGRAERDITINFRLILPGTGAAAAFGRALSESELTIYSGHARMGIGPDFDAERAPAENFVIGLDRALHAAGRRVTRETVRRHHYVIDRVNDLQQMANSGAFDPERYRIWFFNACSTIAYMDELRGGLLPPELDRGNLDVFGTLAPPTAVPVLSQPSLAMLEGIINSETMEAIVRRMNRVGREALRGLAGLSEAVIEQAIRRDFQLEEPYFREGAGDNPVAPPTAP